MKELDGFFAILDRVATAVDKLPQRMATEAVNFSKERFRQQNWLDSTPEPWAKRKLVRGSSKRSKGAVLVDTGRLRRSIRIVKLTKDYAIIGTDVPYAQAHNEGFSGKVTQKVGRHSRKGRTVREHTRTVNRTIEKRQFIGESAVLSQRLQELATNEISRAIKG